MYKDRLARGRRINHPSYVYSHWDSGRFYVSSQHKHYTELAVPQATTQTDKPTKEEWNGWENQPPSSYTEKGKNIERKNTTKKDTL